VAAVEEGSEVAHITRSHQAGLRIEPDSADQLAAAVRWALAHPEELQEMGRRGRALADAEFDRRIAVGKFERVLQEAACAAGRPERKRGAGPLPAVVPQPAG
jgi:glycosyltransferase involved in cell wall biosynthesis